MALVSAVPTRMSSWKEYDCEIHQALATHSASSRPRPLPLAVVGMSCLVAENAPGPSASAVDDSGLVRFSAQQFELPKGYLIMPDVADHMDRSQFLAIQALHQALSELPASWARKSPRRQDVGVVLGLEAKTELALRTNRRIYTDFLRRRATEIETQLPPDKWQLLYDELARALPSGPYTLPGLMPNVAAGRAANLHDLKGPNLVLDSRDRSFYDALAASELFLRDESCRVVVAGGINAAAMAEYRNGKTNPQAEAVVVLVLTTEEIAREEGLPVQGLLEVGLDEVSNASLARIVGQGEGRPRLRAAEGALEVREALHHIGQSQQSMLIRWPDGNSAVRVKPARQTVEPRAATEGTAAKRNSEAATSLREQAAANGYAVSSIYRATPRVVPASAPDRPRPWKLAEKKVLLLGDQADWLASRRLQQVFKEQRVRVDMLYPGGPVPGPSGRPVDVSSEQAIEAWLDEVRLADFDAIVVLKNLTNENAVDQLAVTGQSGGLLDLLFTISRHGYERLRDGETVLGCLCVGVTGDSPPVTGLFGGFVKSLTRELSNAVCKSVATDADDFATALAQLENELGQGARPAAQEVFYRGPQRNVLQLQEMPRLSRRGEPMLDADSVVVVTGGARGVTAVLAERLLRQFGCSLVLLGRTKLDAAPDELLAMDDAAFAGYESEYYRSQKRQYPEVTVAELRARFEQIRAAREVKQTIDRLRQCGGDVQYAPLDITDAAAVLDFVARIRRTHRRLDMVVHGAGVQVSKMLTRKKIADFRTILATKVDGLLAIRGACRQVFPDSRVHFHLLTSVFSFLGNDGQPDYGAANEALNRLAHCLNDSADEGVWTSMAWLGWASVGMTRGSEYAALARSRGLRPVTTDEGGQLFAELMEGTPQAAVNILVSDGELQWYDEVLDRDTPTPPADAFPAARWMFSTDRQTYLDDHRVQDVPTLPGSFEVALAAEAARRLRPELLVVGTRGARFLRFVKCGRPLELRSETHIVEESDAECLVDVRLVSDFVHRSGQALQQGIVHFETRVKLRRDGGEIPTQAVRLADRDIVRVPDPYVLPGSPVGLKGLFDCLDEIILTPAGQRIARFQIRNAQKLPELADFLIPALLLDATSRFAMIHRADRGQMPLFVPIEAGETYVRPGFNDVSLHALSGGLILTADAPRVDGQLIRNAWAQVADVNGRVYLVLKDLVARKMGSVGAMAEGDNVAESAKP